MFFLLSVSNGNLVSVFNLKQSIASVVPLIAEGKVQQRVYEPVITVNPHL